MDIERAMHIARLWRAGKMIGEDVPEVSDTLLTEVERLRAENERLTLDLAAALDASLDDFDRDD